MRYVEARIEEHDREETYRIYVSRSLQLAPQGKYLQSSYLDVVEGHSEKKEEQSGDDIATDIMQKAGLKFGG